MARRPAVVVIIAGVNDVYQGRSAEHVEAELAAMYRRAHEAGIRVVAGSIIPYNTATPEQNARMHEINDWIRKQTAIRSGSCDSWTLARPSRMPATRTCSQARLTACTRMSRATKRWPRRLRGLVEMRCR